MTVLGISDPWIWGGYVACILAVVFCCAYGILSNRAAEEEDDDDGN